VISFDSNIKPRIQPGNYSEDGCIMPANLPAGDSAFQFQGSIRFEGANDFINTGGATSDCWNPYNNTDWTVSWWAKCETGETRFKNNGTIICTNVAASSSNPQMTIQTINATGGSSFTLRIPFLNGTIKSYKSYTSSHVISNADCQVWQHYAVVLTQNNGASTQDIQIYVNGSLVDSASVDQANFTQTSFAMAIGSRNPVSFFQGWEGFLSEIALYEESLSADEISALYNSGNGRLATEIGTPTGYYRPNATDGPQTGSITDVTGNKDLTMNGFVSPYGVTNDTP